MQALGKTVGTCTKAQMHAAGSGLGCKIEFQALGVGRGCRPERQPWGQVLESGFGARLGCRGFSSVL